MIIAFVLTMTVLMLVLDNTLHVLAIGTEIKKQKI